MGLMDFQVNTPFPGGEPSEAKSGLPLDVDRLGRFFVELTDVWLERGYGRGVTVGPFDALLSYFVRGDGEIPCIWRPSCADEFVCIDARGHVAQCDCWVTSYPDFRFGNIFEQENLTELLRESAARQRLRERPQRLVARGKCVECDYLGVCHGGCAIRAYTVHGDLFQRDPYCEAYRTLFAHVESVAGEVASAEVPGPSPGQTASGGELATPV
jgi:radical SAM protein with 4Fe4S-binding SPASM domain